MKTKQGKSLAAVVATRRQKHVKAIAIQLATHYWDGRMEHEKRHANVRGLEIIDTMIRAAAQEDWQRHGAVAVALANPDWNSL